MHNPILDDPDAKVMRWELRQADKAGITLEEWRSGLSGHLAGSTPPKAGARTTSDEDNFPGLIFFVMAVVFVAVSQAPRLVELLSRLGTAVAAWLIPFAAPLLGGALTLAFAGTLSVLRSRRPSLYAALVFIGTFTIAAVTAHKLQAQMAAAELLGLVGAMFGAVDGYACLKKNRVEGAAET